LAKVLRKVSAAGFARVKVYREEVV